MKSVKLNLIFLITGSITGKAVEGELKGTRLEPLKVGDYFAFAWLVFYPDTEIYNR